MSQCPRDQVEGGWRKLTGVGWFKVTNVYRAALGLLVVVFCFVFSEALTGIKSCNAVAGES